MADVTVTPLVWMPYNNPAFAGPDIAIANAPYHHRYQVQRDPWAYTFTAFLHPIPPITDSTLWWESKGHTDLEAAKAAAIADHIAQVMSHVELARHGPPP